MQASFLLNRFRATRTIVAHTPVLSRLIFVLRYLFYWQSVTEAAKRDELGPPSLDNPSASTQRL